MMKGNETLKAQAREYILLNLSANISPWELTVLLSVLDGTTDLGGTSPTMRNVGLGFVAAFVLITSYVVLLWEPKHRPGVRTGRGAVGAGDEEGPDEGELPEEKAEAEKDAEAIEAEKAPEEESAG